MSEIENNVNGLRTSALADGEFTDAKSDFSATEEPEKKTALDLATDIEAKIKALLVKVNQDDEEVDKRLASLTKKVEQLRKRMVG